MKDLTQEVMAEELSQAIKYSGAHDGAVKRIRDLTGLAVPTIYNYLEGRIKISLPFLHAATIATDGDAQVRKFLEPDGFRLSKKVPACAPDKETLAEELLDDLPVIAEYHAACQQAEAGKMTKINLKRARDKAIRELEENFAAVCKIRNWNKEANK